MVPVIPAAFMAWARAVRCLSAASTSAGDRSRPDSPAVPACSVNVSTRASFSACSFRWRAAAGSAEMTSAADQGPQLPAGQPGCLADDQFLDGGGVLIVEAGQFLGDDFGAAFVDLPGGQRGAGQRQPVQAQRQVQQPPGAAPGQREGDRDLVINMIKRPPVPVCWPSASRRAASREVAASFSDADQDASRAAACNTPVS